LTDDPLTRKKEPDEIMEHETSLWINGRIYTARSDVPSASALVVQNGEIAYAGDADTAARVA
jgi:predicted amidohydrolase YtcJ